MIKLNNLYKSYINLSHNESELLNAISPFTVFSFKKVKRITGWNNARIANTLLSLKKKEIISAIKKDNFVIKNKIPENIFAIAAILTNPSFISYWTACSYYGFTEQQLKSIQLTSTKQYHAMKIGKFSIETTTQSSKRFFGYQKNISFAIAEKERLIIDIADKLEKSGGIDEVKKCIKNAWPEIDQKKMFEHLKRFGNKSLFSRLGYILESIGLKNNLEPQFLRRISKNYIKLNPQKLTANIYNKKWRIIQND